MKIKQKEAPFQLFKKTKTSVEIQSFYQGLITVDSLPANSGLLASFDAADALGLQTWGQIPRCFLFAARSTKSDRAPCAHGVRPVPHQVPERTCRLRELQKRGAGSLGAAPRDDRPTRPTRRRERPGQRQLAPVRPSAGSLPGLGTGPPAALHVSSALRGERPCSPALPSPPTHVAPHLPV